MVIGQKKARVLKYLSIIQFHFLQAAHLYIYITSYVAWTTLLNCQVMVIVRTVVSVYDTSGCVKEGHHFRVGLDQDINFIDANGKTIYWCFAGEKGGIYGLDAENYNGVTFPVCLDNQGCPVIGVHAVFFSDVLSRQVKRLDVMTRNIFVFAGSGSTGTSDGKDSGSSFTKLHGIWHKDQVTYVTDAATGSTDDLATCWHSQVSDALGHMLNDTLGVFLMHLGMLNDTLGVFLRHLACLMIHLVCTRRGNHQILHPFQMLSKHSTRLSPLWMTVPQMSSQRSKPQPMVQMVPSPTPTNGPDGTISNKT